MTTISPPGPSTTELITYAHTLGIRVWWRHLPDRDGQWSSLHQSIWLDPHLTDADARSVLAHELGHAILGHNGPQPHAREQAAWRWAARLLITDWAYARAETICGPDTAAIADELHVAPIVVRTYQATLAA